MATIGPFSTSCNDIFSAGSAGISLGFFSRIADIERAVGFRAADDYRPPAGATKKDIAMARQNARSSALATVTIGRTDEAWYFKLDAAAAAALWEGVIMPRRM